MHLLKWTFPDGPGGTIEIELEQNSQEGCYAILSHRWGNVEDEVSFQDIISGSNVFKTKVGYAKLEGCCRQAHQDGHKRIWSDTCCIDKSSSAELSEAITSMYFYYERSQVCYAFLNDIEKRTEPPSEDEIMDISPLVSKSAWFERGWTLQELIAPKTVKFFSSSWAFLGEKTDPEISKDIEDNSGIYSSVLKDPNVVRAVSISSRMSWAANRKTTRIEDRAYSLMGVFGVYMSPIYGEGHNAFIRLQEEIMRTSNDHTLFAWTLPPSEEVPQHRTFERVSTMLALSPDQFKESSAFTQRPYDSFSSRFDADRARLDYTTTNVGLSINLPIVQIDRNEELFAAFLACTEGENLVPSAILLHRKFDAPRGYFWRAITDSGPIERIGEPWFQAAGRDGLEIENIFILPKLSPISKDFIDIGWRQLKYKTSQGTAFEIKRTLIPAKDPCFEALRILSKARHMIYGQTAQFPKAEIEHQRIFPKDVLQQQNRQFFGRSDDLQRIKALFEEPLPTMVLISGVGKIGKTELARELTSCCRDGNLFSSITWIDASNESTIHDGFKKVAKDIGLHYTEDGKLLDVSYLVLQWLNSLGRYTLYMSRGYRPARWLLVFDGAQDDVELLEHIWKPHLDNTTGRILVTTQNSRLRSQLDSETMILGPIEGVEANATLIESLNSQFRELDQPTFALLLVVSLFNAESIHVSILTPPTMPIPLPYPRNGNLLRAALRRLMKQSLVTQLTSQTKIEMLPLVQNAVLHYLNPQTVSVGIAAAIHLLYYEWVTKSDDFGPRSASMRRHVSENLLPHLLRIQTLAEKMFSDSEFSASAMRKLARLVRARELLWDHHLLS